MECDAQLVLVDELARDLLLCDFIKDGECPRVALRLELLRCGLWLQWVGRKAKGDAEWVVRVKIVRRRM